MTPDTDTTDFYEATCGCGFTIKTSDGEAGEYTFARHNCPNTPAADPEPWYSYIFGFWGWCIVATIGCMVLAITGVAK
jgi:hypothetical protein